jgi:osmotically-inducible protein OsmY
MVRVWVLVMALAGASAGCGVDTSTQERPREAPSQEKATAATPPTITVPENPVDRTIRRDLSLAIAQDAELKHREISFIVSNGDVNVTGTVRTEDERRKINELAMNIGGVKSVANGLRVAD